MNLGILLWNTCNVECRHCAVNSSPREVGYMSNEQIFSLIDACFYNDSQPKIGLSGGEAFLYFDRLREIVKYIADKGGLVSVNSNCFWGVSITQALKKVSLLKRDGLDLLVASYDDFHKEFIKAERIINVVQACKEVNLEVELQFVASKKSSRLSDFLKEYADELLNITCREIPVHPVGRAEINFINEDLFLGLGIPKGLCPSSILSISAYGKFIPCCNTAGHLPTMELGSVDKDCVVTTHKNFMESSLFKILREYGPSAFVTEASIFDEFKKRGAYIDQCHLCYELFKNEKVANELKMKADSMYQKLKFEDLYNQYENELRRIKT